MTTRQFGWKLFLILTVLPCCRSVEVSIEQKEYEVARGGDVTFTCSFVPARPVTGVFVITWEASPDNPEEPIISVATYFRNSPIDIAPDYEGRADMKVNVDTQVSTLTLTKVTMQDSRSYQCSVKIPGDDEGTPAATTSLLVLVAPSPPICKIQGEAAYFHNITLTCLSQEGSPQPEYKWTSYSVENRPREFPPKTTEKNGALALFNISRETSGFFVCISANRIGSSSCNLTLAVTPGGMNVGSTAAIVGGVLAGVVLFGIIMYCCCKKRGKKDKHAEDSPGDVAFYDRDASETGEPYMDDKSRSVTKVSQNEEKEVAPLNNYSEGPAAHKFDDDQHSYNSSRQDGKGSEVGSQRYQDNQRDYRRGSRDGLDDERDRYGGSRDRLDDRRDHYSGSRDRLDDERDRYRGSRDRLDDQRDYRSSRDRLDDERDYRSSRDRLDDQRDYRGSRDRLDDQRDYRSSRDRLDDRRDYRGSRDRLDDSRDHYRGSRDHIDYIDDQRDQY